MIIKINERPRYTVTIHETRLKWNDGAETSDDYTEETEDISPMIMERNGIPAYATYTLRELVGILEEYNYLSSSPAYGDSHRLWANSEAEIDYRTGEDITRTMRFSNLDGSAVSDRDTRRIYRLAGLIK